MNDPSPVPGRSGWVGVALLTGLLVGSGLTWTVLAHRHPAGHPVAASRRPAVSRGESSLAARENSLVGDKALRQTPSGEGIATGFTPELVALDEQVPAEGALPPDPRQRNDHFPRVHPQAEGCFNIALAAVATFKKQGFEVRDKAWNGEISLDEGKSISCQLFRGNDYCFCVGTDARGAKVSLQLYNADGQAADAQQTAQTLAEGASATAWLRCRQTGTYYVVVKLESAPQDKVPWGMVSAYR